MSDKRGAWAARSVPCASVQERPLCKSGCAGGAHLVALSAMAERPLILVSNDDGVNAEGNIVLREALAEWADVVTVAPLHEQSGQSHAISLHRPLRHRQLDERTHAIDGTPVDCVYVALFREDLLPRRPDMVVSGINHGPNLGADVHYSGTVAAAREGALRGIPAIAFSALGGLAALAPAATHASALARRAFEATHPEGRPLLLNVNIPTEVRGIRATRLGHRQYSEGVDVRKDPRGGDYYWIGGPGGVKHPPMDHADTAAVDAGFISITPLSLRATNADHLAFASWVAGDAPASTPEP